MGISLHRLLIGLVMLALTLMVGVSAASAATFSSEADHTTITGSQTTTLKLATDLGTTHCKSSSFSGTAEHTSFESLTATPAQSECTLTPAGGGSTAVTTNFNGCDYVLPSSGGFQIKCPEGKTISIAGSGCIITIPAQSVATGMTYTNTGSGSSRDLDISFNLSGLTYSYSGCGTGSGTKNGTLTGGMTASGECPGGPVGIWTGEGEEGSANCPAFHSEAHHSTITGAQTETLVLATDPGKIDCKKATFAATAEATSFESFTATPAQSECTLTSPFGDIAVTASFNGCDYVFSAWAPFRIKCPEGKSIVFSGAGCTVTIPPQSLAGSTSYTNTGSGSSRDLDIDFNLSSLDYSYSGEICGSGTGTTNGTWKGAMTASGECPGGSVGIWTEGGKEGPAECPAFDSEAEHTTITGSQTKTLNLVIDPGTVHCKKATFIATVEGTPFEAFTAKLTQSECTLTSIFGNLAVTLNLNGCDYRFVAPSAFQIKCPTGKAITVLLAGCTITIPAQSFASGMEYANTGSGSSRDLDITFNLSGLAYSYTGFSCGSGSGTTNGTLKGTMTAVGETGAGLPAGIWQ